MLMGLKKSLMGLKRLRKKLPKTWASVAAGSRRIKAKRRMSPLLLEERVVSSLGVRRSPSVIFLHLTTTKKNTCKFKIN